MHPADQRFHCSRWVFQKQCDTDESQNQQLQCKFDAVKLTYFGLPASTFYKK